MNASLDSLYCSLAYVFQNLKPKYLWRHSSVLYIMDTSHLTFHAEPMMPRNVDIPAISILKFHIYLFVARVHVNGYLMSEIFSDIVSFAAKSQINPQFQTLFSIQRALRVFFRSKITSVTTSFCWKKKATAFSFFCYEVFIPLARAFSQS